MVPGLTVQSTTTWRTATSRLPAARSVSQQPAMNNYVLRPASNTGKSPPPVLPLPEVTSLGNQNEKLFLSAGETQNVVLNAPTDAKKLTAEVR